MATSWRPTRSRLSSIRRATTIARAASPRSIASVRSHSGTDPASPRYGSTSPAPTRAPPYTARASGRSSRRARRRRRRARRRARWRRRRRPRRGAPGSPRRRPGGRARPSRRTSRRAVDAALASRWLLAPTTPTTSVASGVGEPIHSTSASTSSATSSWASRTTTTRRVDRNGGVRSASMRDGAHGVRAGGEVREGERGVEVAEGVGDLSAQDVGDHRRVGAHDADAAHAASSTAASASRTRTVPATSWTRRTRHPSGDAERRRGQRRVAALEHARGRRARRGRSCSTPTAAAASRARRGGRSRAAGLSDCSAVLPRSSPASRTTLVRGEPAASARSRRSSRNASTVAVTSS